MDSTFHFTLEEEGAWIFVRIFGDLDENSDLGPLAELKSSEIRFDLSGIDHINSMGINNWVMLLDALAEQGRDVLLARCSPAFVTQALMIPKMTSKALVESAYATFRCTECERAEQLLTRCREDLYLEQSCSACGGESELEEPARLFEHMFQEGPGG